MEADLRTPTTLVGTGGQHSMLGWFRNSRTNPPKPGRPVYCGERPEGRPYGNDLGYRRSAAVNAPRAFGLKKFSWE